MKLRQKLMISAMLFTLLPLIPISFYLYTEGTDILEESQRLNLVNLNRSGKDYIDTLLKQEMRLLKSFSNEYLVQKSGEMIALGLPDVSQFYLDQYQSIYHDQKAYASFYIADGDGRIVADTAKMLKGEHLAHTLFFKRAMTGHLAIGGITYADDEMYVIHVAAPLMAGNEEDGEDARPHGVIGALLRMNHIQQKLRKIFLGPTGYQFLVDQNGIIISHPASRLIKKNIYDLPGFENASITLEKEAFNYIHIGHQKQMVLVMPLDVVPWSLVSVIPEVEYLGTIHTMRDIIVIVGILFAVIAFLCTRLYFDKLIHKRLNALTDATTTISQGQLDSKIEQKLMTKDEIGSLANSIDDMRRKLKISRDDLQEYSRTLEKQVENRTLELKRTHAEKMEAIAEMAETRKLALVGQVAGKMAHDFNNVLSIIMGNAEMSLLDCKEPETRTILKLIFEQTIRGKNLTKNLVAFAKSEDPKQEYFPIHQKIDLVLKLLKKDLDGITITREYVKDDIELLLDPGMMEHLFVNIIQNSIHATSLVEKPRIKISTEHKENKVCITIEDNGCGIPAALIEKTIEPSFTLKGSKDTMGAYKPGIKGSGYGLANVKRYVEQHKGSFSIKSDVNEGTSVTIMLPVIKKELTGEEIETIKKEKFYTEKRVLLVEDEQAISEVQYKILTNPPCRHEVDIADTGQAAIDLFNRNNYDIISLDYILQGGSNGMDVYHHIRETDRSVPILFVSGNIEFLESIRELKQKDPHVDHLSKPCMNVDYIKCLNILLEG